MKDFEIVGKQGWGTYIPRPKPRSKQANKWNQFLSHMK
jgi:hypothetical protein